MTKFPLRTRPLQPRELALLRSLAAQTSKVTKVALVGWHLDRGDDVTVFMSGLEMLNHLIHDGYLCCDDGGVFMDDEQKAAVAFEQRDIDGTWKEALRILYQSNAARLRAGAVAQRLPASFFRSLSCERLRAIHKSAGPAYLLGVILGRMVDAGLARRDTDGYYLTAAQREAMRVRFPYWDRVEAEPIPEISIAPAFNRAGRVVELE
jgi:hypothetical protein